MTAAQFLAMQRRLVPFFNRGQLKVGTFLHGWLLDGSATNRATFESYLADDLLASGYDWFGIDTYQTGTAASPGTVLPGDRIDPLLKVLASTASPTNGSGRRVERLDHRRHPVRRQVPVRPAALVRSHVGRDHRHGTPTLGRKADGVPGAEGRPTRDAVRRHP
jgi:hypothetical protein